MPHLLLRLLLPLVGGQDAVWPAAAVPQQQLPTTPSWDPSHPDKNPGARPLSLLQNGARSQQATISDAAATVVELAHHQYVRSVRDQENSRVREIIRRNPAGFNDAIQHATSQLCPDSWRVEQVDPHTNRTVYFRPVIPRRLIFTYKHDLLKVGQPAHMLRNVRATIQLYRDAWGEPDAPVLFLDDDGCRREVAAVAPSLLRHFNSEQQGQYKGDICRLAALYRRGGYYFDIDLRAIAPVPVDPCMLMVVPLQADQQAGGLFQAFLASPPLSPILRLNIRTMEEYYDGKRQMAGMNVLMGPTSLAIAMDIWRPRALWAAGAAKQRVYDACRGGCEACVQANSYGTAEPDCKLPCSSCPLAAPLPTSTTNFRASLEPITAAAAQDLMPTVWLLREQPLLTASQSSCKDLACYPALLRQQPNCMKEGGGGGCHYPGVSDEVARGYYDQMCNYVVHDPTRRVPYFYSRIRGSQYCPMR
jgi:hypothetical protein